MQPPFFLQTNRRRYSFRLQFHDAQELAFLTLHPGYHLLAGPNGHWQIPKSWGLGGQCDVLRV
jgi:hypothetical protein